MQSFLPHLDSEDKKIGYLNVSSRLKSNVVKFGKLSGVDIFHYFGYNAAIKNY